VNIVNVRAPRFNGAIAMPTEPPRLAPRGPTRFLPPVLWMGLIALGSSSLLSGDRTGRWMLALLAQLAPWASPDLLAGAHFGLRKLGHLVEFGILAILWHRSLVPAPRAVSAAFALAAAYGGLDELRQGLDPTRTPALGDVVVDAVGAGLGLAAWTGPGPLRTTALWCAAAATGILAGLAVAGIALDASLGRPVADIGVAAVGLCVVAVALCRMARGQRSRAASGPRTPRP
jgi:VanZ family protein